LAIVFLTLVGLLLLTNIILGSELIRALPGILSGQNIAMPRYLAYMIMGAITLLELIIFSGIIDVFDGVDGLVEWMVIIALWVVLPFDVVGNVFGVVLGNAPISEAMERVTSNMFRFVFVFQEWSTAPDIWAQIMIVGKSAGYLVITAAVMGLSVLIGAGPEFFIGKILRLYFPGFIEELRNALKLHSTPAAPMPGAPFGGLPARPVDPAGNPAARPVDPTAQTAARPTLPVRPSTNAAPAARPVGQRPAMPGDSSRRNNE